MTSTLLSDNEVLLLFGLALVIGLVGVLVPVVPGLLVIAVTTVAWAWWDGGSAWVIASVMLVVLAAGTAAKYVLPSRSLRQAGAPRSTLVLAAVLAVIGFFVVPVIGFLLGGILGVWVGELRRLHDSGAAWTSTWVTLKAIGVGVLLEITAGVVAIAIWVVSVLVR